MPATQTKPNPYRARAARVLAFYRGDVKAYVEPPECQLGGGVVARAIRTLDGWRYDLSRRELTHAQIARLASFVYEVEGAK